jgi:hypothetical protein
MILLFDMADQLAQLQSLNNSGGEKAPGQKNGGGEASKGAAAEPVHRVTPEGGEAFSQVYPGSGDAPENIA